MFETEIQRRRREPGTPTYCAEGGGGPFFGCTEVVTLLHPLPTNWDDVRCPLHRKEGGDNGIRYDT